MFSLFGRFVGQHRYPLYAMSSLLFAVLIALQLFQPGPEEALPYSTAVGEQRVVVLPDSSKIHLNTDTSVSYSQNRTARRLHLLRGEVFLDVTSMPDKPFEVELDEAFVRVLGTQFSVRVDGEKSQVTVLEGRVGVLKDGTATEGEFTPDVVLTQNQQVIFNTQAQALEVTDIDAQALMSWRNKVLVYQGVPLRQVVDDLNRYFDTRIALDGDRLGDKQVVASMKLGNFETVVAVLAESLGLNIKKDSQSGDVVLYEE